MKRKMLAMTLIALLANDASFAKSPKADIEQVIEFSGKKGSADPTIPIHILGQNTKVILDTGSSEMFLMSDFVEKWQKPDFHTSDRNLNLTKHIDVEIGHMHFTSLTPVTMPTISGFNEDGIAGLMSPQKLMPRGTVILDFPRKRILGFTKGSGNVEKLIGELFPGLQFTKVPWIGREYGIVFIDAAIGDRKPVLTDVDTGKSVTSFCEAHIGNVPSVEGTKSINAQNEIVQKRRTAESQSLRFKGFSINTPVDIFEKERISGPYRWCGSIGMDVLKDFVIVLPPMGKDYIFMAKISD